MEGSTGFGDVRVVVGAEVLVVVTGALVVVVSKTLLLLSVTLAKDTSPSKEEPEKVLFLLLFSKEKVVVCV